MGLVFILELGRRSRAPISLPRMLAATCGARGLGDQHSAEARPDQADRPHDTSEQPVAGPGGRDPRGVVAGAVSSVTGAAIYQARGWQAGLVTKLLVGSAALLGCLLAVSMIATPRRPSDRGRRHHLGRVGAGLRRRAAARGDTPGLRDHRGGDGRGCGGLFVPLLSIGDLCGRALAPGLGVSPDLAASAGAAGGVAGGYRLPLTACAMVLTVGGPLSGRLTCAATVLCAVGAAIPVSYLLDRYVLHRAVTSEPPSAASPSTGETLTGRYRLRPLRKTS